MAILLLLPTPSLPFHMSPPIVKKAESGIPLGVGERSGQLSLLYFFCEQFAVSIGAWLISE